MHTDVKKSSNENSTILKNNFIELLIWIGLILLKKFGEDLFDALTKCFDLWQL